MTAPPPGAPARDGQAATLPPRAAYDLIARHYDDWHWQEFWRLNEAPSVLELVGRYSPAARTVVDVGTGTGLYAGLLSSPDNRVVGVDISGNMLRAARSHVPAQVRLVQGDAVALPVRTASADVAVAARVFSHLGDVAAGMGEAARVLRAGGHLVLTDLDAAHRYPATRVKLADCTISIDTYKWPSRHLIRVARQCRLSLLESERIAATTARWLPPADTFPSIDRTGERGIGRILVFRRD